MKVFNQVCHGHITIKMHSYSKKHRPSFLVALLFGTGDAGVKSH